MSDLQHPFYGLECANTDVLRDINDELRLNQSEESVLDRDFRHVRAANRAHPEHFSIRRTGKDVIRHGALSENQEFTSLVLFDKADHGRG